MKRIHPEFILDYAGLKDYAVKAGLKPYAIVERLDGGPNVELISWPFIDTLDPNGDALVFVRTIVGDPMSATYVRLAELGHVLG